MRQFLLKIAKRILIGKQTPANASYIKSGIIKSGKLCDLESMTVFMADNKNTIDNIIIGDNCCIRGRIILYRSTSRVIIGDNVYIGPNTCLECVDEIKIGSNVLISSDCNLIDTNSHSLHSSERIEDTRDWQKGLKHKNWNVVETKKINIEDHCWVGLRSIIMKGVDLKEGTIVASGSVVTKTTEPFTVIGGNPAKFIKHTN
jgi:acetyltransferase-like isoleucine patch superfamily enzyme